MTVFAPCRNLLEINVDIIQTMMFSVFVTTFLLGCTVSICCAWLLRRPKNLPPGPWSLPIIGYRAGSGLIHECYASLAQRYGPIFSFRRGPFLVVVLNNRDVIQQALVKNADVFSDRFTPKHVKLGIPASNPNASVVWSSGKPWGDLRKFGLTALRAFGMGKKSIEPHINLEVRYLCEEIEKLRGHPTNLLTMLNNTTANVICRIVFGRRFEYDDEEFQGILRGFFENFSTISGSDLVNVFSFLLYMPWYKDFRRNLSQSKSFIMAQLKLHTSSFEKDNIRDIIDAYLADEGISKDFTVEEFCRVVLDFFAAGTETTSTALSWAILYLCLYPDVQTKVQSELDTVVGRGRQPAISDRARLPYCEAALMESMRIRPVLPLSLPHTTSRSVSLGGFTIPQGTTIIPNIWAAHHDPEVWDDPDDFRPERFLENHDSPTVKKNDSWIPFGLGRRECLGAQLAKMESFLLFTNLFQRFEFKLPPDQSTHSKRGISGLTMPPEPYEVCAIER
ncbi:cytochrome P450 2U1-like [Strongylocentrotus purpuratus]|uniref:Cytochrome P450 n=1 Tax=Strongylocentrotus purpuratus TaxID=7668 RepID=A0A7M7MYB7_STRPU|nr:cytochrome P450 2U1-like [Strongylocentrotus purpuratus]